MNLLTLLVSENAYLPAVIWIYSIAKNLIFLSQYRQIHSVTYLHFLCIYLNLPVSCTFHAVISHTFRYVGYIMYLYVFKITCLYAIHSVNYVLGNGAGMSKLVELVRSIQFSYYIGNSLCLN